MTTARAREYGSIAALLLVVAVAFLLRLMPEWSSAIEGDAAVIRDPDASYHLRRAEVMAEQFPSLATFDSYIDHPEGAHVIWPPLYDLTLAGLLAILPAPSGARGPSMWLAMLPPLLDALTVALVYLLARYALGAPWLALYAAAIAALLPASYPYTKVALLDHHAVELAATALVLVTSMRGLGRATAPGGASGLRATARSAGPAAVALAAALGVQLSLVMLVPLVLAAALAVPVRSRRIALRFVAWVEGGAALLVLPWSLAYHLQGASFAHDQFGLFQPATAAAAGAVAWVGAELGAPARRRARRPAIFVMAAIGTLLTAIIVGEFVRAFSFVTGRETPWVRGIGESRGLVGAPAGAVWRELSSRLSLLAVWLIPAAVAWWAMARRGTKRLEVLWLAALLFAVLAATQARYVPHLALLVGPAAAWGVTVILRRWRRPRVAVPVVGAVTVIGLLPTIGEWGRPDPAALGFDEARPVLEFLARSTPPTSHYLNPIQPGEYGVLAPWSYGHFIQYHGRRPAVIDNFGSHAGDLAFPRRFFLETDEQQAVAVLAARAVRYVLVGDVAPTFEGLVPTAAERRRFVRRVVARRPGQATVEFAPEMSRSMLHRLAWRSGGVGDLDPTTGRFIEPLARLRLVAESAALARPTEDWSTPAVKLFELVRGAVVEVCGRRPGESGALFATIRTPRGRELPYVRTGLADSTGCLSFRVPYATAGTANAASIGSGEIRFMDGAMPLPAISEGDVLAGRTVRPE